MLTSETQLHQKLAVSKVTASGPYPDKLALPNMVKEYNR